MDFIVEHHGSVSLVRPMNENAETHLRENVDENAQWFGGALAVEDRYVWNLVKGLESNGFTVGGDE